MGAVVGYCGVVNVVVIVKVFAMVAIYCCRSAIVKCMLCHSGSGIGGVVIVVVRIVWY